MTPRIVRPAFATLLALGLAGRVAAAQVVVLSNVVEETTAARGASYRGTIVLQNSGAAAQSVRLYQTDYAFWADGTSAFDAPGTSARSNAAWLALGSSHVTVPAGQRLTVPYTVTVPANDSLTGTYWSAIMVEGETPAPEATSGGAPRLALAATVRYAVQVATHIAETGTRTARFDHPAVTRAGAKAMLDVDVVDAGTRGYRPVLWAEVYDAQGELRSKARQERGLLYPASSLHQHFDLGSLPAGAYKILLFADTGDDAVFAAQFAVTL